jgi:ADP-heptose:LPS heptosyltransferase
MHLANAVGVPVLALMRQKNPEWVPFDREGSIVITAARRSDWVKEIRVEEVMKQLPAVEDRVARARVQK